MGAAPTVRFADAPPATADLAIIGGGVVGCATAFFAARAGLSVVVLERRAALATLTTPVSTGAFRLQFDNAEEIELVREGIELFESFAARTGLDGWDLALNHAGYVFCSLTDATVERSRRLVERQRDMGPDGRRAPHRRRGRARGGPGSRPRSAAARYRARDGWLDPKRLSVGYATAASNAAAIPDATPGGGATFVNHAGAHEIVVDGDRVRGVRTTRGEVAAGAVVIATGPFLSQTAGLAGIGVELRPTRRQKLVLPSVPQVPADAPMTIEEETAAHWRPVLDGAMALFTDPGTPPSEPHDPVPIEHDWAFGLLDPHSDHALARVAPVLARRLGRWRAVGPVVPAGRAVRDDPRSAARTSGRSGPTGST